MSNFMYEETFFPNWPDDQRVPYALIMLRLSELCRSYCRNKIKCLLDPEAKGPKGWRPSEDGLAFAYEQYECACSSPIEELMLEVATIILDGGRSFESEKWMNYHRSKIKEILQKNDLRVMISGLPQPERGYFESDIKLLEPLGFFGG